MKGVLRQSPVTSFDLTGGTYAAKQAQRRTTLAILAVGGLALALLGGSTVQAYLQSTQVSNEASNLEASAAALERKAAAIADENSATNVPATVLAAELAAKYPVAVKVLGTAPDYTYALSVVRAATATTQVNTVAFAQAPSVTDGVSLSGSASSLDVVIRYANLASGIPELVSASTLWTATSDGATYETKAGLADSVLLFRSRMLVETLAPAVRAAGQVGVEIAPVDVQAQVVADDTVPSVKEQP